MVVNNDVYSLRAFSGYNSGFLKVFSLLDRMWYIELLSSQILREAVFKSGARLCIRIDKGWLEVVGPQGVGSVLLYFSEVNGKVQSNYFLRSITLIVGLVVVCSFVVRLSLLGK